VSNLNPSRFLHFVLLTISLSSVSQTKNSSTNPVRIWNYRNTYLVSAIFSNDNYTASKAIMTNGRDLNAIMRGIDSMGNHQYVSIEYVRYIDSSGHSRDIDPGFYHFTKAKYFTTPKNKNPEFLTLRSSIFNSGMIYFSGTGFPGVIPVKATDINLLSQCYGKCAAGTIITLSNCVYKNPNGSLSEPVNKTIKLD